MIWLINAVVGVRGILLAVPHSPRDVFRLVVVRGYSFTGRIQVEGKG